MRELKEREICGWKKCLDESVKVTEGGRQREGRILSHQSSSQARDVADKV